jgi:hypothetical protein
MFAPVLVKIVGAATAAAATAAAATAASAKSAGTAIATFSSLAPIATFARDPQHRSTTTAPGSRLTRTTCHKVISAGTGFPISPRLSGFGRRAIAKDRSLARTQTFPRGCRNVDSAREVATSPTLTAISSRSHAIATDGKTALDRHVLENQFTAASNKYPPSQTGCPCLAARLSTTQMKVF